MESYAKKRGFKHQTVTLEQASSNELAKNFMGMLAKVAHTMYIEHKDPWEAVQKYLLFYWVTPHSATGKTPAGILYNRNTCTVVPVMLTTKVDAGPKERDAAYKRKTKEYHDKRRHAKSTDYTPSLGGAKEVHCPLTVIGKSRAAITATRPQKR